MSQTREVGRQHPKQQRHQGKVSTQKQAWSVQGSEIIPRWLWVVKLQVAEYEALKVKFYCNCSILSRGLARSALCFEKIPEALLGNVL